MKLEPSQVKSPSRTPFEDCTEKIRSTSICSGSVENAIEIPVMRPARTVFSAYGSLVIETGRRSTMSVKPHADAIIAIQARTRAPGTEMTKYLP